VSRRRPFGEVVGGLVDALMVPEMAASGLRVTRLTIDIPVEVALERSGPDLDFIAEIPRWRWRSEFDRVPGRLVLHVSEGIPE